MATRRTPDIPSFTIKTVGVVGGANIRDAPNFLAQDQVRPIENVILTERGGGQKRLGCLSHGTFGQPTDRVLSLYVFNRGPTLPPQMLMHTSAGAIYVTDFPTGINIVWTPVASGLSTTEPMSWETFGGKAYMSNGVDAYASWDGATRTPISSAPKGKFIKVWEETMWVSGVTGFPDRVYVSDLGNPDVFGASSFIDLNKGDGDVVRALASDGRGLIVGKRDRTIVIFDPVELFNRILDYEKGFESHFAVAYYESELYFLSRRGICRYLGDSPSQVVSDLLDPLFSPELIALDQLHLANAYVFQNRIGIALPERGSSRCQIVIEYYPRLGTVTNFGSRAAGPYTFHRMPTHFFARWRYGTEEMLFAGADLKNKIYRVFAPTAGTDDGTAYQAVMQTPFFDMGDPTKTKYLRDMRLLCSGKFWVFIYRNHELSPYRTILVDAQFEPDYWDTNELWGDGVWGDRSIIKDILKTNLNAYGRYFAFRIQDSGEVDTGHGVVFVGAREKEVSVGEWSVLGMAVNGSVLGDRP